MSSDRPDFDTENAQGIVIVAALAPGDYEIFATTAFQNHGTVQTTFKSSRSFSIPFGIRASEAVYLGSFRAQRLTGKNIFGVEITAGATFYISDAAERDLDLARRREGRLPTHVASAIPDPVALGSPIISSLAVPRMNGKAERLRLSRAWRPWALQHAPAGID